MQLRRDFASSFSDNAAAFESTCGNISLGASLLPFGNLSGASKVFWLEGDGVRDDGDDECDDDGGGDGDDDDDAVEAGAAADGDGAADVGGDEDNNNNHK